MDLHNHKGSFCVHADAFCQEGYCSECNIYRQRVSIEVNFFSDREINVDELQETERIVEDPVFACVAKKP